MSDINYRNDAYQRQGSRIAIIFAQTKRQRFIRTMKEIIQIQNLKCGGCAATIAKAIKAFPEVENVAVNLDTADVSIETQDAGARAKYEAALAKAGYPPVGADNNLLRQAKSFVSCAIGRMDA